MNGENSLQSAAIEFCQNREQLLIMKAKRASLKCESAYPSEGDYPCWMTTGLSPEDVCDNCKEKMIIHQKVVELAKKTSESWRKFKKENKKIK